MIKIAPIKIVWLLLPILFLLPSAQASNTIKRYIGGRYELGFDFYADLSGYSPLDSRIFINNQWRKTENAYSMWGNPARLNHIEKPAFVLEWAPPFRINLNNFSDLDASFRTHVDLVINEYRDKSSLIQYPRVDGKLSLHGEFGNFVFAFPIENKIITIGYRQIMNLQFSLLGNGHEASILVETEDENPKDLVFNNFNKLYFDSQFSAQILSIATAGKVLNNIDWGISLNYYFINAFANGIFDIQGSILYDEAEYLFNDPNASWPDRMNQSLDANYNGQGLGLKTGVIFKSSENVSWDVDFEYVPVITIKGDLEIKQYQFPALNTGKLFEYTGDYIIDPNKLNFNQITRTYPYKNQIDKSIIIRFPSSLGCGLLVEKSRWLFYTRLRFYLRELSFHYLDSKAGLKPSLGIDFGFKNKWFQLNSGLVVLKEIREGLDKHIDKNRPLMMVPMPKLTLCRGFTIMDQQRLDSEIMLLPVPTLKFRLTVTL